MLRPRRPDRPGRRSSSPAISPSATRRSTAPVLQLGFAALVEHPAEAALLELDAHDRALVVRQETRSLAALPHARTPVLTAERAWRFDGGRWHGAGG